MPSQSKQKDVQTNYNSTPIEVVWTLAVLALLVSAVILVWLGWVKWVIGHFEMVVADESNRKTPKKLQEILELAGPFGDLFGGINALFTGLGLAFLIYTIRQQSRMIRQQQISIAQHSTDLRNQRNSAERSQALQSMLQIRAVLQDEGTRKAREIVLSGVGKPQDIWLLTRILIKKSLKGTKSLTQDERELYRWYRAAERVLHTYDFVGVLIKGGHIQEDDLKIINDTWGESIKRCYSELQSYLTVPFRPKGITESDTDAIDNMDTLKEKFPKNRLHGLPYKNFVKLVGKMR